MDLEATIKALKDGIIKETLLAENNQDLSWTSKDAAFCWMCKQKEETLVLLTNAQGNLKGECKDLLLKWLI